MDGPRPTPSHSRPIATKTATAAGGIGLASTGSGNERRFHQTTAPRTTRTRPKTRNWTSGAYAQRRTRLASRHHSPSERGGVGRAGGDDRNERDKQARGVKKTAPHGIIFRRRRFARVRVSPLGRTS